MKNILFIPLFIFLVSLSTIRAQAQSPLIGILPLDTSHLENITRLTQITYNNSHFNEFYRRTLNFYRTQSLDGIEYDTAVLLDPKISQNIYFEIHRNYESSLLTEIYYKDTDRNKKFQYTIGYIYSIPTKSGIVKTFVARADTELKTPSEEPRKMLPEKYFSDTLLTRIAEWSDDELRRDQFFHRALSYIMFTQRYVDALNQDSRRLDLLLEQIDNIERTISDKSIQFYAKTLRKNIIEAYTYYVNYQLPRELIGMATIDFVMLSPGLLENVVSSALKPLTKFKWVNKVLTVTEKGELVAGKSLEFVKKNISYVALKGFSKLSPETRVFIKAAANKAMSPISYAGELLEPALSQMQLANDIFNVKLATMPNLKRMLELYFPAHLSISKEVIPILKRSFIWDAVNTFTGAIVEKGTDDFLKNFDSIVGDFLISFAIKLPFAGKDLVIAPESSFIDWTRSVSKNLYSTAAFTAVLQMRQEGLATPTEKDLRALIKSGQFDVIHSVVTSHNLTTAEVVGLDFVKELKNKNPIMGALLETIYRVEVATYNTVVKLAIKNQLSPLTGFLKDIPRTKQEERILGDLNKFKFKDIRMFNIEDLIWATTQTAEQ